MGGDNLTAATVRNLTERIVPWAKFRGRAALFVIADPPDDLPDVTVAKDADDPRRVRVFIRPEARQAVRTEWAFGPLIDTIPDDDEIAAWLAWAVIERGGDRSGSLN